MRERLELSDTTFVDQVVWQIPSPVRGSPHLFKYSLALVSDDLCVLRYDNEAGKGDHKHVGGEEEPYRFVDLVTLASDFWTDVMEWRQRQ